MSSFTRHQLTAAAIIVLAALAGTGVLVAKSGVFHAQTATPLKVIQPGEAVPGTAEESSDEPVTICIHVAGKVTNPGIYQLDPESRVSDAVKAAGGASANADLETINLAELLQDGQQVYIAPKGEVHPPAKSVVRGGAKASVARVSNSAAVGESSAPSKLTNPGDGTVNINTADFQELQRLPGVGPATAQKILDYRTQSGRFAAVEELEEVNGIGPARLEKMRPFVTL